MKRRSCTSAILALVTTMVATACSALPAPATPTSTPVHVTPSPPPMATSTPSLSTPSPQPAGLKVLRVRHSRDPKSLEPALFFDLVTRWVCQNLHAGLLRFDNRMLPAPFIAQSWEISADGLTYTFKLRDNVMFHNGRKVVASDFVYTFTRYLDPRVKSGVGSRELSKVKGAREWIEGKATQVEGLQAPDDTTFRIILAEPDPTLLLNLSTVYTSVIPREAVVEGEARWKDQPVGAGAFKFVEWQPGVKVVLEANPNFFLGRPKLDRVEYITIPDDEVALARYQAGELDVLDVRSLMLKTVNQDTLLSKELNTWPRAFLSFFGLNQNRVPAFQDKRVRQALIYALDRQALIEKALYNDSSLATGYVPAGISGAILGEKAYPYDPAQAQALLAEAGFPNGQGFPKLEMVSTADQAALLDMAAAQLKANLGIETSIRIETSADFMAGVWAKDKWDVWETGWSADRPMPDVWLYELFHSQSAGNYGGYANAEYDQLADQARATTAPGKRVAAWQEVEKMAYEEAPIIPLSFGKFIYLVKPYVKDFSSDLLGPMRLETVEIAPPQ